MGESRKEALKDPFTDKVPHVSPLVQEEQYN